MCIRTKFDAVESRQGVISCTPVLEPRPLPKDEDQER